MLSALGNSSRISNVAPFFKCAPPLAPHHALAHQSLHWQQQQLQQQQQQSVRSRRRRQRPSEAALGALQPALQQARSSPPLLQCRSSSSSQQETFEDPDDDYPAEIPTTFELMQRPNSEVGDAASGKPASTLLRKKCQV